MPDDVKPIPVDVLRQIVRDGVFVARECDYGPDDPPGSGARYYVDEQDLAAYALALREFTHAAYEYLGAHEGADHEMTARARDLLGEDDDAEA